MILEELYKIVIDHAEACGCISDLSDNKCNTIIRKNLNKDSFEKHQAYFGFIRPNEEHSGPYHDFSLVFFVHENEPDYCIVSLGVGSDGFLKDTELASLPGLRRKIVELLPTNDEGAFLKNSFLDIDSSIPDDSVQYIKDTCDDLDVVFNTYSKVIPAYQIVNFNTDEGIVRIKAWIAQYAKIRSWYKRNKKSFRQQSRFEDTIEKSLDENAVLNISEEEPEEIKIKNLLQERKYIILQGAPGVGKTHVALKLAHEDQYKVHFTQFHAETTYADFIYGITPNLSSEGKVLYKPTYGEFYLAVKDAIENPKQKVLLIIDEINRANLANVLGEVFYLFEFNRNETNDVAEKNKITLSLGEDLKITDLPSNLYVIGTMNTADRSLAVVDFALRRRFAWYTIKPHVITDEEMKPGNKFYSKEFKEFKDRFDLYANDEELDLQPGQGYFIARSQEEMNRRIEYELMPLMKEYLSEGKLYNAKDSFSNMFYRLIKKNMYQ
ncbi:MAG: AAA family ATPase [Bacteroidales bacterium]|nr:AAA family ATPase [Bacteroidales bacterium]